MRPRVLCHKKLVSGWTDCDERQVNSASINLPVLTLLRIRTVLDRQFIPDLVACWAPLPNKALNVDIEVMFSLGNRATGK